jgi:hypothetical protein
VWTHCRGKLIISRSLPTNASTHYIAPSLRLFVPNSLPTYLLFQGLCLWRLWSVSSFSPVARFSRWLLSNCFRCSLLKATRPEPFPHKMVFGPGLLPSFFWSMQAKLPGVANAFTSPALAVCAVSFVSNGVDLSAVFSHLRTFCRPVENATARFAISNPKVFLTVLLNALLLPRRSCFFKSRSLIPLLLSWSVRCLLRASVP